LGFLSYCSLSGMHEFPLGPVSIVTVWCGHCLVTESLVISSDTTCYQGFGGTYGRGVLGGGRIVVFGDSDFASDAFYTQFGNGDIFINSVDWAAEQEELINLTPKDNIQRFLLPPQSVIQNLILLGVVFVLPGVVLLAGAVVWVQKRQRG